MGMRRWLCAALCAVWLVAGMALPASACSAPEVSTPAALLNEASIAFVGTLVGFVEKESTVELEFEIERVLRGTNAGPTVTVVAGRFEGSCTINLDAADISGRFGIMAVTHQGRYHAAYWQVFTPEALIDVATTPLPPPTGDGPARYLVGGLFGGFRLVALDDRFDVLGYGLGSGTTLDLALCPGDHVLIEAAAVSGHLEVVSREVATLVATSVTTFDEGLVDLVCLDEAGTRWAAITNANPTDYAVIRFEDGRPTEVWSGTATDARFAATSAVISSDALGQAVITVDIETGTIESVADLDLTGSDYAGAFVPDADRSRWAGITQGAGRSTRLVLIDGDQSSEVQLGDGRASIPVSIGDKGFYVSGFDEGGWIVSHDATVDSIDVAWTNESTIWDGRRLLTPGPAGIRRTDLASGRTNQVVDIDGVARVIAIAESGPLVSTAPIQTAPMQESDSTQTTGVTVEGADPVDEPDWTSDAALLALAAAAFTAIAVGVASRRRE